jgi:hypothetical protein
MSNGIRLERVSRRTFRVRGAPRVAQDAATRGAPADPQIGRFAMISRFATGSQRHAVPRRNADP